MFERIMEELDLDDDGSVTKKEFADAYILKYDQLLYEK